MDIPIPIITGNQQYHLHHQHNTHLQCRTWPEYVTPFTWGFLKRDYPKIIHINGIIHRGAYPYMETHSINH